MRSSFIVARFVGGIGIGVSTVAAPLYISEIAPAAQRGRLAAMFQFNIVLGIVIAFLSNALLAGVATNAWRWMLGVAAVPSLAYTLMCLGLPESPRWLLTGVLDRPAALRVLSLVMPGAASDQLEAAANAILAASAEREAHAGFWTWRLRVPIALAFLVAFFNQLSPFVRRRTKRARDLRPVRPVLSTWHIRLYGLPTSWLSLEFADSGPLQWLYSSERH